MSDSAWHVLVATAAATDIQDIANWTEERFGLEQARRYSIAIADALELLQGGPAVIGVNERRDINSGLYTLHLARRGRHFVLFRVTSHSDHVIEVLRIPHDGMDLARHLPDQA